MRTEILILGSGPAGLQSAIYSARRNIKTTVLGKINDSSLWFAEIENYFGIAEKTTGKILLENFKNLAIKFGVEFIEEDAVFVDKKDELFEVKLESDNAILTKSIIIATGVARKKLNIKGEKEYLGKGVSYCVDCDGMFFRNRDVAVIGDSSSAKHAKGILEKIAKNVYQIKANEIIEIAGNEFVEKVILQDNTELKVDGVFIELGAKGAFELFQKFGIKLDQSLKHIEVDKFQKTNIDGVFACGDITGVPYQVAKAVGEGAIAGISCAEYVKQK